MPVLTIFARLRFRLELTVVKPAILFLSLLDWITATSSETLLLV